MAKKKKAKLFFSSSSPKLPAKSKGGICGIIMLVAISASSVISVMGARTLF